MVHKLKCTLEQLYNGKTFKLAVQRQVMANPDQEPEICSTCNGQGAVLQTRQLGRGMIQQVQTTCPACNGLRYNTEMKSEKKVLEVIIEKGMSDGAAIRFAGESDQVRADISLSNEPLCTHLIHCGWLCRAETRHATWRYHLRRPGAAT